MKGQTGRNLQKLGASCGNQPDEVSTKDIIAGLIKLRRARALLWGSLVGLALVGLLLANSSDKVIMSIWVLFFGFLFAYSRFKTDYGLCPRCGQYFGDGISCSECGLSIHAFEGDPSGKERKADPRK